MLRSVLFPQNGNGNVTEQEKRYNKNGWKQPQNSLKIEEHVAFDRYNVY